MLVAFDHRLVQPWQRSAGGGPEALVESAPPGEASPLVTDHTVSDSVQPKPGCVVAGNIVELAPRSEEGPSNCVVDPVGIHSATAIVADRTLVEVVQACKAELSRRAGGALSPTRVAHDRFMPAPAARLRAIRNPNGQTGTYPPSNGGCDEWLRVRPTRSARRPPVLNSDRSSETTGRLRVRTRPATALKPRPDQRITTPAHDTPDHAGPALRSLAIERDPAHIASTESRRRAGNDDISIQVPRRVSGDRRDVWATVQRMVSSRRVRGHPSTAHGDLSSAPCPRGCGESRR